MSRRRSLSWSAALRDLRDDRAKPKDIREERLAHPNMSAWRGESGKRYAVARGELSLEGAAALADGTRLVTLIAARRVGIAPAGIVDLYAGPAAGPDLAEWIERARLNGATELHAYRIARTAQDRASMVDDLADEALRARRDAMSDCRAGFVALIGEAA